MERHVFLDSIRSAHNVGAIFRTAEGAGVSHLYLGGYTPAPVDRFARPQAAIRKTSLGASELVPWTAVPAGSEVASLKAAQAAGFQIVALEQTATAVSLYDYQPASDQSIIYVVGNEIEGVAPDIVALADIVVAIPMAGQKESLNVATATGILLFHR